MTKVLQDKMLNTADMLSAFNIFITVGEYRTVNRQLPCGVINTIKGNAQGYSCS